MHDIKEIRIKADFYKEKLSLRDKSFVNLIDELISIDKEKRDIQQKAEDLRKKKNEIASQIGKSKDNQVLVEQLKKQGSEIGNQISEIEKEELVFNEKLNNTLLSIPNIPHDDVPFGEDETKNQEILKWGTPRSGSWIKPHDEVGVLLKMFDFERGVKISQSRFTVLTDFGAKLERALMNFMLDQASEKGYREIFPPILINQDSMKGTGQLPKFAGDFYKCEDEDLYLAPTAEVPITNLHRDEILDLTTLPIKYAAYTPCFRKEAGAAGKDTRGIIRQHQFNKVELVKITSPESSVEEHEKLTNDAEDILKKLELPYRKVLLCSGDMGFSATKCYDLEVWFPSQNTYREISSCSNFGAFQARRLNLKYKPTQKDKPIFAHTINGSGLAIGRTLAAILENYQTEKGTVIIPEVLQKYLGGIKEIV